MVEVYRVQGGIKDGGGGRGVRGWQTEVRFIVQDIVGYVKVFEFQFKWNWKLLK